MNESTTDIRIVPTPTGQDVLIEVLRDGARRMLAQAVEAEVAAWIDHHAHLKDDAGRQQVVRNGHLPQRTIQTGIGPIEVQQPRVRDRRSADQREAFTSAILPPYLRKTRSLEGLIPWLYLKGLSTGDFSEALQALLGPEAPRLSATTVTRLKAAWEDEHEAWSKRSLKGCQWTRIVTRLVNPNCYEACCSSDGVVSSGTTPDSRLSLGLLDTISGPCWLPPGPTAGQSPGPRSLRVPAFATLGFLHDRGPSNRLKTLTLPSNFHDGSSRTVTNEQKL